MDKQNQAWSVASIKSILQAGKDFCGKIGQEHKETNPTCICRRCCEAAYVRAALNTVQETLDEVLS